MEEMTVHEIVSVAYFRAAEGHDRAAADLRAHISRREKNAAGGLHAALLYLRAGEREAAIELMRQCRVWTTFKDWSPDAARRAGIFLDSLESGQPLDQSVIQQIDREIDGFEPGGKLIFHAIYGELFFYTGNPEAGMDLLQQAVAFPPATGDKRSYANYDRAFATVWLRERLNAGGEPSADAPPAESP